MIKLIALLKANPKLSNAEFREYYETVHAKRTIKFGFTHLAERYTRSYYQRTVAGPKPQFDVIMELWFKDEAHLDKYWELNQDPDIKKIISEDEAYMFDLEKFQLFIASEETGWGRL